MKIKLVFFGIAIILLAGCSSEQDASNNSNTSNTVLVESLPVYPIDNLPEGLVWETNNEDAIFASPDAIKGGRYRLSVLSFPLTLRTVGPDSNSSFRPSLLGNQLSLTSLHPNTKKVIPELATHWAYADDQKTIYYKLNPNARWSDGLPITADDFLFTLEFMRSSHIVAPWYNNHYSKEIVAVKKYDDHTISVTGATAKPKIDLHYYYGLQPRPRHFHKLDENWVTDYNWKIEPNSGPYQISKIKKGKFVEFKLKPDWWAKDLRYFKHRFNVETVKVSVVRDLEIAYKHFLKGELDAFPMVIPEYWHEKTKHEVFDKGYVNKIWFYNDIPQPSSGIYLNQDYELLADKNVRYAFSHAMNMQKMIKTVLRSDYLRLHNMHTGYGEYSNKGIRAREFDLAKVDEYLNKAGWGQRGPDGIRVKDNQRFSVLINYGAPHHTDRLVVLKEEAKKAGLELQLQLLDSAASYKNVIEKKHQAAWMGWSTGFRPAYWQHFHSENAHKPQTNNITNTDNPEMDAMIMQYRTETDEAKRITLAKQLQQHIHDSGVYVPTYMVPYTREAYWRWLKLPKHFGTKTSEVLFDVFGTSTGGLFWIDEAEKEKTLAAKKAGEVFEPVLTVDETYRAY